MTIQSILAAERATKAYAAHITNCFNGEVPAESLTMPALFRFYRYLTQQPSVGINTAYVYMHTIVAVLKRYSDDYPNLAKLDLSRIKMRRGDVVKPYISIEELERLERLDSCLSYKYKKTLYAMLVECKVGCRVSDLDRVDTSAVHNGILTYVATKTGKVCEVPISQKTIGYITRLKRMIQESGFSEQIYRRNIKHICEKAGMTDEITTYENGKPVKGRKCDLVSSHTMRRSFCTNLYLLGVDLKSIAIMAGHSNVTMTERYICCGLRKIDDKVLNYF